MAGFDEERYLDVLQNIEFAVIKVYRSDPELLDAALSALIAAYNARRQGKVFDSEKLRLNGRAERVFSAVGEICEWRIRGGAPGAGAAAGPPPRSILEILACLRRVRTSVRRWTKMRGRRGYLEFVQAYLP